MREGYRFYSYGDAMLIRYGGTGASRSFELLRTDPASAARLGRLDDAARRRGDAGLHARRHAGQR